MSQASPQHSKLAVIGSSSMVGSRFCELASSRFSLILADLRGGIPIDIISLDSVKFFFEKYDFEHLILFSAFTDVDAAENQRGNKNGLCWQINVKGISNVINSCQRYHRKLIFISTDFIFDGTNGPYGEEARVGPNFDKLSWYGITKIEAENLIKITLSDFIIFRISYPYRSRFKGKEDIVKRILRFYRQGKLYPMFIDQIMTPTFVDDLAPAVELLLSQNLKGIFHLASPLTTTQFDFAKEVISTFGGNHKDVKKGSMKEFLKKPGSTPRPIKGGLKVDKIIKHGFRPTDWKSGIKEVFTQSKGELL